MEADRVVLAGYIAVTFVFLTALLIAIDWAAAKGRLRRNQFVGIRTPSTMSSDHAWMEGHRAAWLTFAGVLLAGTVGTPVAVWTVVALNPKVAVPLFVNVRLLPAPVTAASTMVDPLSVLFAPSVIAPP